MGGFISVARKTMEQTNRDSVKKADGSQRYPDKTKQVSQAFAEYEVRNGEFVNGLITVVGEADDTTLKLLKGSLLSPEAGKLHYDPDHEIDFKKGSINVLFRGLSDMRKAKDRLNNWLTKNQLSTKGLLIKPFTRHLK